MAVNLPSGRYLTRTVNGLNIASGQVYTAMGWFYAAWADGNWHNVFFFGPNSSIHDNVEVDTTGKTIVSVDFSAGVTGSTLTSNTWHHWAVVRSSDTDWSLYLDGVLDCTETVNISGRTNNASAWIGNWAGAGDDLIGRIQDVKIWQAALTAEEIKREMKQSAPMRWTNLLHWAPMRDQTVSKAEEDRSGRDGSWTENGSGTVTIADGNSIPYRFGWPRAYVPPATGAQTISGVGGIATAEAFGTAQLNFALSLTGIATAEAFGSSTIVLYVAGAGAIATAEAFGSPSLHFTLGLTGITSAEAFGSPTMTIYVNAAGGIATSEAFGTPDVAPTTSVVLTGIASSEAFGSPSLHFTIVLTGIASAEAFGVSTLTLYLGLVGGIASAEAFGTPALNFTLGLTGIASAEAFGSPALGMTLLLSGIASAEAFGTTVVLGGVVVQASALNTFTLDGEVPAFRFGGLSGPARLTGERIVLHDIGG